MERRDFCRYLGICGLAACTGGLSGCARLLDWSESQRGEGAASRTFRAGEPTPATEATRAAESSAATAPSRPAAPVVPDLAVYRGEDPAANVRAALAALGGMERFVKRGARVAIKPNILTARAPEYAATTNPTVVATLVTLAYEAGARDVVVFDRPTAPPRNAYEVSGIAAAVETADGRMKVLGDSDFERIRIPEGKILTSWPLAVPAFDADVFINVPIAKTHGMAGLTMSMKNLMGIMGSTRGLIHQDFDQKIVDVNSLVKPHLVVLDATRILVRNGPSGGSLTDVRRPGALIAGTVQASVDAYGTTLFGMKPTDLTYLVRAAEQGQGVIDLDKLDIVRRMRREERARRERQAAPRDPPLPPLVPARVPRGLLRAAHAHRVAARAGSTSARSSSQTRSSPSTPSRTASGSRPCCWQRVMLVLPLVAGRAFCGYACPMGTIVEITGGKSRPSRLAPRTRRVLRKLPGVILLACAGLLLFASSAFLLFDPLSTLTRSATVLLYPLLDRVLRLAGDTASLAAAPARRRRCRGFGPGGAPRLPAAARLRPLARRARDVRGHPRHVVARAEVVVQGRVSARSAPRADRERRAAGPAGRRREVHLVRQVRAGLPARRSVR